MMLSLSVGLGNGKDNSVRLPLRLESFRVRRLTQRSWQIRATSNVIKVLTLHFLLVGLTMVEVIEVAHDNGNRECNGQDTSNGT